MSHLSLEERFLKYVIKNPDPHKCWKWIGYKTKFGYGRFRVINKEMAHRVSYSLFINDIPDNMLVLHKCDVPECCNPLHLWLGNHKENAIDRDIKGRRSSNLGSKNSCAKINESIVKDIRNRLKEGFRIFEISKMYNISRYIVYSIKMNINWKHI